jgi:hypothetical protein
LKHSGLLPVSETPSTWTRWWRVIRRILITTTALVIVGIWALIGPLPKHMMKARHDWLTAPDDPHPQYYFDGARGTLASSGTSGNWTMYASECTSGQARAFYGVSLSDRINPTLAARIVQPESGVEHVTVQMPNSDEEVSFGRQQCSVWDVDIHYDGTLANSIRELAGHARFECSQGDAHIVGNLELRKCH